MLQSASKAAQDGAFAVTTMVGVVIVVGAVITEDLVILIIMAHGQLTGYAPSCGPTGS